MHERGRQIQRVVATEVDLDSPDPVPSSRGNFKDVRFTPY